MAYAILIIQISFSSIYLSKFVKYINLPAVMFTRSTGTLLLTSLSLLRIGFLDFLAKESNMTTEKTEAIKAGTQAPISLNNLLKQLSKKTAPQINISGVKWHGSFKENDIETIESKLINRGIISTMVLAERALSGVDMEEEASSLGITPEQAYTLHAAALASLTTEQKDELTRFIEEPKGKGSLTPEHPEVKAFLKTIGIEKRQATLDDVRTWGKLDGSYIFLPKGPIKAVDHRPKLGPARNQGSRPSCTSFGATVVAEALEYLRDRRPGPRDFSEEYLWWYSKNGALITAGGYSCHAALYHYETHGAPSERFLPYSGQQINSNHVHVPVPDSAMDRAHDHRQPSLATLEARNVAVVKAVLETGRCVSFASDTYDWNTGTGIISFPDPLDSRGVGGGHCTTIIGYIDRDDLPAHFEGGYFIVRNSWGGANSTTHVMGPEYGGHLLMPYGWYSRYTGWPATLGSYADSTGDAQTRGWRAEYFSNPSLRGLPSKVDHLTDLDLDWGSRGPFGFTIDLPIIGEIEVPLPPFDQYSARFSQVRRMRSGWYRFQLKGDDGIRLWVDDRLVINAWKGQPTTTYETEHYLSGGDHVFRVEYYEAYGQANVELDIQPVDFHFELYPNTDLSGASLASFDDCMTDLEWRHAPPVSGPFHHGQFSLRVTGQKQFAEGTYRFHARHTGGCRIWLGDQLVLDDWTGTNGSGSEVNLAEGNYAVKVEFAHRDLVPAMDAGEYYRAALAFDWSNEDWHGRVYIDPARQQIRDAGFPNIDSIHEAFRVQSLTGNPVIDHRYSIPTPVGTSYIASDSNGFELRFPDKLSFGNGISPGTITDDTSFLSAIVNRRIFIATPGRYQVTMQSDEAFRVSIDGNKVLEKRYGGNDPFSTEIVLTQGVHDVSFEYADSGWSVTLGFKLEPANWDVKYYSDKELSSYHSSKTVIGIEQLVASRPTTMSTYNWSAVASRRLWLPVGRFRLEVRSDDGVRVKVDGNTLINAWKIQPPTTYTAFLEHDGGAVDIEIEYFQQYGGAELSFELHPDGFLGEYYRGITLEIPANSASNNMLRNPPYAYRFEPTINFDWGGSGRLARVGADHFSARWWGSVELPVGRWKFKLTSDDGVRLFLDDRLLIDRWHDQSATTSEAIVDIATARRDLRVEYYEKSGAAVCRLEFERML